MADISSLLALNKFVLDLKHGERTHVAVFPADLVRRLTAILKGGLDENGVVDTHNEITEAVVKDQPVYAVFRMLQMLAEADVE
jgi:hypothetical protein